VCVCTVVYIVVFVVVLLHLLMCVRLCALSLLCCMNMFMLDQWSIVSFFACVTNQTQNTSSHTNNKRATEYTNDNNFVSSQH